MDRRGIGAVHPSSDPDAPLWRAAQAFRLLTFLYVLGVQIAVVGEYTRPNLSWVCFALLAMWTGGTAIAFTREFGRRWELVLADLVVVVGLMAATRIVADRDWTSAHQPLTTTLWAANAVISAAILRGPVIGLIAGLAIGLATAAVKGDLNLDIAKDATLPILVTVGVVIGLATKSARRTNVELQRAARIAAATAERERLARQVHDGVLQVLAYVRRRGNEIGGPAAELASLAGDQEVALRELISTDRPRPQDRPHPSGRWPTNEPADADHVDLRPLLRTQASTTVSVSAPPDQVLVDRAVAVEVAAVVKTALSNVALHAGPGAKAFVLIEDLGTEIVVSIRDDGVGIAEGRLLEAESEGRMGVSKSILGRIRELGGQATLETGPEMGTEWELRVPTHITGEVPDRA